MKIDHLTLSFRNKIILEDIDIEIKPGEFVFFIWYSWSGKTSLIRAIIWDFKPERWDVILDNNVALYKLFREDMLLNYRRSIWVIFQDYKLLESKKVYENVAFAMEVCGYKDDIIRKKVPEALEKVWLLIKKDKFVYELSGWEKQRVAIARALVWSRYYYLRWANWKSWSWHFKGNNGYFSRFKLWMKDDNYGNSWCKYCK